ncbi:MAG TPA: aldose epimerase family protein [Lacibacter sp.]|nr:aldose epimerase family protein [Lacibacter sp.]HMO89216.1 aldose epimerase family protein [Lacibacter sp.]
MPVRVNEFFFGAVEGRQVNKYVITAQSGLQVAVINYGATLLSLVVPDRYGRPGNVLVGFNDLDSLQQNGNMYAGAICGRYANRISNACFSINGTRYQLTRNEGQHCLHGGGRGFDKVVWDATVLPAGNGVRFTYRSNDGEEGFPGNLEVAVEYSVTAGQLSIAMSANTDAPTPVSLTAHPYFNLSGGTDETIAGHELQLHAQAVLETDADCIPTGRIFSVADSHFDFSQRRNLGTAVAVSGGYDHCWVVDRRPGELAEVAALRHPATGRMMRMYSTLPGLQVYTGQYLHVPASAFNRPYGAYAGLCLEPQMYPDAPNHPHFPDTVLHTGQSYHHLIQYQFTTQ